MYAVYVLEDMWRLRSTFSTSDTAIFSPLALSIAGSAKVFRYASAPPAASATRERGGKHGNPFESLLPSSCRISGPLQLAGAQRTQGSAMDPDPARWAFASHCNAANCPTQAWRSHPDLEAVPAPSPVDLQSTKVELNSFLTLLAPSTKLDLSLGCELAHSHEKLGGVLFLDEDEYRRWAQQPAPPAGNH
jgi:hypothetical protein